MPSFLEGRSRVVAAIISKRCVKEAKGAPDVQISNQSKPWRRYFKDVLPHNSVLSTFKAYRFQVKHGAEVRIYQDQSRV